MDSRSQENDVAAASRMLWQHSDPSSTRMYTFRQLIQQKHGVHLADYESLRQWSVKNLNAFWCEVWHFTGIVASQPFLKVGQASRDLSQGEH